jgi:hypothetical protein
VEPGRTKALTRGLVENRTHLRPKIGGRGFLGLPGCIVGVSGIEDGRNFVDRGVAGGDVVVFSLFCRRCGGRNCGGEKERDDQPENGEKDIVHVRWSVAPAVWFKVKDCDQPSHVAGARSALAKFPYCARMGGLRLSALSAARFDLNQRLVPLTGSNLASCPKWSAE